MARLTDNRKAIEQVIHRMAEEAGLLLVASMLKDSGSRRALIRLYVDKEGGVTIPECSDLSRKLAEFIEEEDIVKDAYVLEVSSPGIERPFAHRVQYKWCIGKKIHVLLRERIDGKFIYEGELTVVGDDSVTLKYGKGKVLELPFDDIKEAYRMLDFGKH